MKKAKNEPEKRFSGQVKSLRGMKIGIPLFVLLILALSALIRIPYTAKESYTEIESREVTITEIIEDRESPVQTRICEDAPSAYTVREHYVYGKPYGVSGYKCYAKFRVTNDEETKGEWTYRYVFDISGKKIATAPATYTIPTYATIEFNFETEECTAEDTVKGAYELLSGPTVQACRFETQYRNRTVTRTEIKPSEVQKERLVRKYEPLWQWLAGANKREKV